MTGHITLFFAYFAVILVMNTPKLEEF